METIKLNLQMVQLSVYREEEKRERTRIQQKRKEITHHIPVVGTYTTHLPVAHLPLLVVGTYTTHLRGTNSQITVHPVVRRLPVRVISKAVCLARHTTLTHLWRMNSLPLLQTAWMSKRKRREFCREEKKN